MKEALFLLVLWTVLWLGVSLLVWWDAPPRIDPTEPVYLHER